MTLSVRIPGYNKYKETFSWFQMRLTIILEDCSQSRRLLDFNLIASKVNNV